MPTNTNIKIIGIDVGGITDPSEGNPYYNIPFMLNEEPSALWSSNFVKEWQRAKIANISDPDLAIRPSTIVLCDTTIERVRDYFRAKLVDCVRRANANTAAHLEKERIEEEERVRKSEEHRKNVEMIASEISFE